MALTVIVEAGTGSADSNSYADVVFVRSYNAQRGVELDDDNDVLVPQIMAAMDYLETYEARFQGERVLPLVQALSWPRANASVYGATLPSNVVPRQLASAVAYLVGVVQSGVDLYAVQDSRAITKEVIGPLETDYSATGGATITPIIPNLDAMLRPLLKQRGVISTVRV